MPRAGDTQRLRTVAPAKVNWTLEVLGRRADGYHEIRSVMQTISLADTLVGVRARAFALTIDGPELVGLNVEENLVTKAARSFRDTGNSDEASMFLTKQIPAAAGLGGGSSDAAATLRLIPRLATRAIDADVERIAADAGSDVPFFLRGGLQRASGRGEVLQVLPSPPPQMLVVLTPPIRLTNKSARLYAALQAKHFGAGDATEGLVTKVCSGGRPDEEDYVNVFDRVADLVYPELGRFRTALESLTGSRAMLAGAGPSLFAVARRPTDHLPAGGPTDPAIVDGAKAWVVRTLDAREATRVDVE